MVPKIGIIGAGPAGLALARLLSVSSIQYTLFERDASPSVPVKGGTLDLHEHSGQMAVRAAGLYSRFMELSRPEGESIRLADKTGRLHLDMAGGGGRNKPEIDRQDLRNMFLEAIPADTIRWGKKVESIVQANDELEKWKINFADGESVGGFDLIVGADGAWSKVRPLVTDVVPYYSGVTDVEFQVVDANSRRPDIGTFVGDGAYFAFGSGGKAMLGGQRNSNGFIRIYSYLKVPENWVNDSGIDFSNTQATKERLLQEYYNDWSEGQQDLIKKADDNFTWPRRLYMLPVGLEWKPRKGITVVGDAAHLMTPFAGVGVNIALEDSYELSQKMVKALTNGDNLQDALAQYEAEMFVRARKAAEKTYTGLVGAFSENFFEMVDGGQFHD